MNLKKADQWGFNANSQDLDDQYQNNQKKAAFIMSKD